MGFFKNLEPKNRRDFLLALLVSAIVLIKRLLIASYGINREAPIEMESILLAMEGNLIYRDFIWYHGFFPIYWHALIFKLFSPEMVYLRLFVTVFATVAAFFAYWVARFFLSPGKAFAAALLGFTGLIVPEHVTGTMMAFCFFILSFYWILDYCKTGNVRSLFFAGLAGGVTSLAQVLPLGFLALVGGGGAIICFGVFERRETGKNLKHFLWGYLPLPVLGYGGLALIIPTRDLWTNLLPMFSGFEANPKVYATLPFPDLFPALTPAATFSGWIAPLNTYLVSSFRWWLIVLIFFLGLIAFGVAWRYKKKTGTELILLGTLVLYGPLFEGEFLLYTGRLGLTPNYINMLPTFILLFYLLNSTSTGERLTSPLAATLLLVYLVYPFGKYYAYFSQQALPLGMPHSKGISVSPYKHDLYHKTVKFIRANTAAGDKIVFAGVNRYFSIFSGRKDVFRSNFLTFIKTSFYPRREADGWINIASEYEKDIVDKIASSRAKLLLMPETFFKNSNAEASPFLFYLEKNWTLRERFGNENMVSPYEYEPPLLAFTLNTGSELGNRELAIPEGMSDKNIQTGT
ncbi:MAG: hypothetical protein VYC17_06115 [Nitrospinota bacterium]|nr:hypothetical protein [Nitrospinota bacterium]